MTEAETYPSHRARQSALQFCHLSGEIGECVWLWRVCGSRANPVPLAAEACPSPPSASTFATARRAVARGLAGAKFTRGGYRDLGRSKNGIPFQDWKTRIG